MIKRTIIETVEEYDENGKLTRKTTTETKEDDDTGYAPIYTMGYSMPVVKDSSGNWVNANQAQIITTTVAPDTK